jgi:hypothetical protein
MYLKVTSKEKNTSSAVTMPSNAFQANAMKKTSAADKYCHSSKMALPRHMVKLIYRT